MRFQPEGALQESYPLFHTDEPQTFPLFRLFYVETHTVIGNRETNGVLESVEGHPSFRRTGMLGNVAESLLGHAIEGQCDVGVNGPELVRKRNADFEALFLAELGAMRPQCGSQSQVLHDGRMKTMGQATDVIRKLDRLLLEMEYLAPELVLGQVNALLESAELQGQGGQFLVHVVMELAGDTPPFLLARFEQSAGKTSQSFLGLLLVCDVVGASNDADGCVVGIPEKRRADSYVDFFAALPSSPQDPFGKHLVSRSDLTP
jgi:hypothetical protein